jgi:hypothetical protein
MAIIETEDHLDRASVLHRQVVLDLERPQHRAALSGKSRFWMTVCAFLPR